MKAAMLNPFLTALPEQCLSLCGTALEHWELSLMKEGDPAASACVFEVPVYGQLSGSVFFHVDEKSLRFLAGRLLLDLPVSGDDAMARHAVQEIFQRVAVKAEKVLVKNGYDCTTGPPRLAGLDRPAPPSMGIRVEMQGEDVSVTADLFLERVPAHLLPCDGAQLH